MMIVNQIIVYLAKFIVPFMHFSCPVPMVSKQPILDKVLIDIIRVLRHIYT